MYKKYIKTFNYLRKKNVRFIKTIIINIKVKGKRSFRNIILLCNGHLKTQINKTATINIYKGVLELNTNWVINDGFPFVLKMDEYSKWDVHNTINIHSGSRISISKDAHLITGGGFINNNFNLSCFKKIEIGEGTIISENVCIRDSDNHTINGDFDNVAKPIKIGNNVWIGLNVVILKGVTINDGCVIAAGSVVNKNVPPNCLAAGIPAKVIKTNVFWQ